MIRPARVEDVPIILQLIRDLATYERAPDDVTATQDQLVDVLFGEKPAAEVLLASALTSCLLGLWVEMLTDIVSRQFRHPKHFDRVCE